MSFRIPGPRLLLLGLQLFGRKSGRDGKRDVVCDRGNQKALGAEEDKELLQGAGGVGDVGPRNPRRERWEPTQT